MEERLERRLRELRVEYEAGERMLAEFAEREASLRQSMLRISGAIQVLEELHQEDAAARPPEAQPSILAGA